LPKTTDFFVVSQGREEKGREVTVMNRRIRNNMEVGGEGGFTLIELLVVIIIIAILAAIAIPMYLSQRQKGWEANARSDLRNAAVAQESYFTDNDTYTTTEGNLTAEGFNPSANVTMTYVAGTGSRYCMSAVHDNGGDTFYIDSDDGEPTTTACV